jgi:predicted transcriptional regulator
MADKLTIPLHPEAAKRLRQLASASGESLEAMAQGLLEDTAAEFDGAMGDDAELARRVAAWKADGLSIASEDVHAWLKARLKDPGAPRPVPTRTK